MAYYSFTVRGVYPNGNKGTFNGYVQDEGEDFAFSAFRKAVQTCKDMTPGLIVDESKPGHCVLRKLKKRPKLNR